MKIKTRKHKWIIRWTPGWEWKTTEHYTFRGPFVIEKRKRNAKIARSFRR